MCFAFRVTQARLSILIVGAALLVPAGPLHAQQTLPEAPPSEAPPAQAQPAVPTLLTLELATEILLQNNPMILAARQDVVAARADVIGADLWPNPEFGFDVENLPVGVEREGPVFGGQELVFKVEQLIETAGKRGKRTAVAEHGVEVSQSELLETVRVVKFDLQRRHYDIVLAKATLELSTGILEQFDEIIRLSELRYQQGEVSGLEVGRLKTERLRFFADQTEAQLALSNSKIALLELLGVTEMGAEFDVADELQFYPVDVPAELLEEQALANRPDLTAQLSRVQQALGQEEYEKSLGKPDLTPYFGYRRDFIVNALTFGVSLPLPFSDRNQGGVGRAMAETGRQRQELRQVELQVRREVREAHNLVTARAAMIRALRTEYVPSARRARDIAEASYSLGALDLIAFLDAERAYRATLLGYYQSLYDHQVATFLLQAVVGERPVQVVEEEPVQ
jgi:cobalt-zinc-cadmium efflux system outer membrane protein